MAVRGVWRRYTADLAAQWKRVSAGSHVIAAPSGQIEYATAGTGPRLLVLHGAGGGFDQAISAASRLIGGGFEVIAPSRFGYLRSASPAHAALADQADAYAFLLDTLRIQRVHVIGVSVGALSALQFAVRHQYRCRSLTVIVPAASAAGTAMPAQGRLPEQGPLAGTITELVLGSDLLDWLGVTCARNRMIRLVLGTDPAVLADADPGERNRAYGVLRGILPISARKQGFLTDTQFVTIPQSIAIDRITAPTLVASVEDDHYRTLESARFIAAAIPHARLITYRTGGHAWVGHDAELFAEVDAFLKEN